MIHHDSSSPRASHCRIPPSKANSFRIPNAEEQQQAQFSSHLDGLDLIWIQIWIQIWSFQGARISPPNTSL